MLYFLKETLNYVSAMIKAAAKRPLFIRLADLAEACESHPNTIERYIYRGVIEPDADVQHGKVRQPIFNAQRLAELKKAVSAYQERLKSESVG